MSTSSSRLSSKKTGGFGWSQGLHSSQPHVAIPAGTFEEEHGRAGFYGRASHLYHRHPPTGWLRIEGELKPRSFFANTVPSRVDAQPVRILENLDVRSGVARFGQSMDLFVRNADGDEIRFVDRGAGTLQTDYGDLLYSAGDFLVIPKGTTYRFVTNGDEENIHFVIESSGEVGLPDRGMLGRHAFFDPALLRTPELPEGPRSAGRAGGVNAAGEFELRIQREGAWTKVFYPWSPIDVAGWKGDLCPWAIHISELRPVVSARVLLPPSAYTVFEGEGFIVCAFVPRPAVQDEAAERVPFYHRNADYDEILFHHHGKFSHRTDLDRGRLVWHPQGIHHGPHPTSAENACKIMVDEIGIMVDTIRPLRMTAIATEIEDVSYPMSWSSDQKR